MALPEFAQCLTHCLVRLALPSQFGSPRNVASPSACQIAAGTAAAYRAILVSLKQRKTQQSSSWQFTMMSGCRRITSQGTHRPNGYKADL